MLCLKGTCTSWLCVAHCCCGSFSLLIESMQAATDISFQNSQLTVLWQKYTFPDQITTKCQTKLRHFPSCLQYTSCPQHRYGGQHSWILLEKSCMVCTLNCTYLPLTGMYPCGLTITCEMRSHVWEIPVHGQPFITHMDLQSQVLL